MNRKTIFFNFYDLIEFKLMNQLKWLQKQTGKSELTLIFLFIFILIVRNNL